MYFDWLSDNIDNPKLLCIKCEIEDKILSSTLIYVKSYLFVNKPLLLKDREGNDILTVKLPPVFSGLHYDKIVEDKPDLKLKLLIEKIFYGHS